MEELLAFNNPVGVTNYQAQPSPLPTAAPHPRNVIARLFAARQVEPETCAYADAESSDSITCSVGRKCVELTSYNVFGCCLSQSYPDNCGTGQTSCINYADTGSCTGACASNPAIVQCTDIDFPICGVTVYDFSTLTHLLTGFSCAPDSTRVTAFPYFSLGNGSNDGVSTAASIAVATVTVTASSNSSNSDTGGNNAGGGGSNSSPSPTISSPTSSPTNTGSSGGGGSGLSSGAKAGIAVGAVGAVAIIAALIFFIFFQKRRTDRARRETVPAVAQQNAPPPMTQQQSYAPQPQQQQQPMMGSPNMQQSHMSMTPSATSSGVPLTAANIAAMSHHTSQAAPSEVLPSESASQIGGPGASMLSGASPPGAGAAGGYYPGGSGTGTGSGGEGHSGVGPLPQYATGASAFPHSGGAGAQSVLSQPSAFGSAPPVHAPSVAPFQGEQR